MVQLEEVPDEELNQEQPGPDLKEEDDEWESDTGTLVIVELVKCSTDWL